jgi:hypothetical protein
MSAQSRATRKWPVGRIKLEAALSFKEVMNRCPFWTLVLNLAFLFVCAPTRGIARIVTTARSANRPLHLVLRLARRLRAFLHFTFAPLMAAFEVLEDTGAVPPTPRVARPKHNSFPPGFAQFFASFAAVPVG